MTKCGFIKTYHALRRVCFYYRGSGRKKYVGLLLFFHQLLHELVIDAVKFTLVFDGGEHLFTIHHFRLEDHKVPLFTRCDFERFVELVEKRREETKE